MTSWTRATKRHKPQDEEGPSQAQNEASGILQPEDDHFPLCIVWTPLPVLTWIVPFIGHLGIATSAGEIHDFAGPYFVNRHQTQMGFGKATKYWPVDLKDIRNGSDNPVKAWDEAIQKASSHYDKQMVRRLASLHNLCCNNCHDHVSMALNQLNFKGIKRWNTVLLIVYLSYFSKFVDGKRFVQTYFVFVFFFIIAILTLIVKYV